MNNTIQAFNDLDNDTKNKIKDLKIIQFTNITQSALRSEENFNNRKIHEDKPVPLVYTNQAKCTGIHLSIDQFERFEGMSREESLEIAKPLFQFITRDKYCYYHEWEDGDVSFSDQWLGVHRRLRYEDMSNRMVHRATFDYPDGLDYARIF